MQKLVGSLSALVVMEVWMCGGLVGQGECSHQFPVMAIQA